MAVILAEENPGPTCFWELPNKPPPQIFISFLSERQTTPVEINPKIAHGKPIIKGTRIMVASILSLLAGGYSLKKILEYYPQLKEEDVKEAIQYALKAVQEEEIKLLP